MLQSGSLPSLQNDHHRRRNRPSLPTTPIPLVRYTSKSDLGLRPPLHIQLRKSPHPKAQGHPKHKYRVPPTDRWTDRTKESMGGAVPPLVHLRETRQLGAMAPPRYIRTQPMAERYNKAKSPRSTARISTKCHPR